MTFSLGSGGGFTGGINYSNFLFINGFSCGLCLRHQHLIESSGSPNFLLSIGLSRGPCPRHKHLIESSDSPIYLLLACPATIVVDINA